MSIEWKPKRMVVTGGGRLGMLLEVDEEAGTGVVTFGGEGPRDTHFLKSLRYATADEVRNAGYEGVGRDESMEGKRIETNIKDRR